MLRKCLTLMLLILVVEAKVYGDFYLQDLFELKRISCDFKGSVTNGKSLLVFGNGGVVLRTTDIGKTWEQINLNDSLDITQMLAINHTYFGNGTIGIFKSNDDLMTWELHYFKAKIIKIFKYKGNLLCVTTDKIIVTDTNFKVIKEIKIKLDQSFIKPIKGSSINYSVELVGNNLAFYSKEGKFAFLNLETEKMYEVKLKNFQSSFDLPIQTDIKKIDEGKILFLYEHSVLIYTINHDTVDFFYTIPDTLNPQKFVFYPENDTIFVLFTRTNLVIDWDSLGYSPYLDSVYFGFIDPQSKRFINIKVIENDYSFNDLLFLDLSKHKIGGNDVVVGVGIGKLIYISYDLGKHWHLKSLLNIPYLLKNDIKSVNFKAPIWLFSKQKGRIITEDGRFYATDDGGATWLPQKNYLPRRKSVFNPLRFAVFIDSLRGMFISSEVSRLLKDGKGITPPNQFFTSDGGKTVDFREINVTNITWGRNTLLKPFGQPVLVITPRTFYLLDDSLKIKKEIQHIKKGNPLYTDSAIVVVDSLYLISAFEFNDTLWAISPELQDASQRYNFQKINFYFSADTGINWTKLFQIDIPSWHNTVLTFVSQYKDTLLLIFHQFSASSNPNSQSLILLIDLTNKNYKVLVKPFWLFAYIFQICSHYYLFYYAQDKQNVVVLDNWENNYQSFQGYEIPRFQIYLSQTNSFEFNGLDVFLNLEPPDSTFPFVLYDALFGKNALYFAKIKPCVEINIPRTNSKDFYVSNAYPNPAKKDNIVKFRIFLNPSDKVESLSISAYDILGKVIANTDSFQITQSSGYSCNVEWQISDLSPGVYLIVASLGSKISSNVVVIY